MGNRVRKGFTLIELLIVVAIIAILVGIGIPVLSSTLEKSREAADLANIRSAYAKVMVAVVSEEEIDPINLDLAQKKEGWDTASAETTLNKLAAGNVVNAPVDGSNTAEIKWLTDEQAVQITFNGSSAGGNTDEGSEGEGDADGRPQLHSTGGDTVIQGMLIMDETGACVVKSDAWAVQQAYSNNKSVAEMLADSNVSMYVQSVNTNDVKDASKRDQLQVGDLYYKSSDKSYYLVTYLGSEAEGSGWMKIQQ